ncbi:MAG: hypothetical protein R3D57_05675 [Hyphomicrobiaceae bacterium]
MNKMGRTKTDVFKSGNVFAITLSDKNVGYCYLARVPIYKFLRQSSKAILSLPDLRIDDDLFTIMVDDSGPKKKWKLIGNIEKPYIIKKRYEFCSINVITGRPQLHILDERLSGGEGFEVCDFDRCASLESAGIWSPESAAMRLSDELNGRENAEVQHHKQAVRDAQRAARPR